jgi:hypothetical protein
VEQLLPEHQLRVAHRETHASHDRGRACPNLLAFLGVFVPLGLRQWWALPPKQIRMSGRDDRSHCTKGFFLKKTPKWTEGDSWAGVVAHPRASGRTDVRSAALPYF